MENKHEIIWTGNNYMHLMRNEMIACCQFRFYSVDVAISPFKCSTKQKKIVTTTTATAAK